MAETADAVSRRSTPVGVVTLAEDIAPCRDGQRLVRRMRARMIARFALVREKMDAVARVHPRRASSARHLGHGDDAGGDRDGARPLCPLPGRCELARLRGHPARRGPARRARPCRAAPRSAAIGPDRADLVLPGCAIFAAIHALWPCAQLRVADRGLREGMLRELMLQARRMTARPPDKSGRGEVRAKLKTRKSLQAVVASWLERQLNDPYVRAAKTKAIARARRSS